MHTACRVLGAAGAHSSLLAGYLVLWVLTAQLLLETLHISVSFR